VVAARVRKTAGKARPRKRREFMEPPPPGFGGTDGARVFGVAVAMAMRSEGCRLRDIPVWAPAERLPSFRDAVERAALAGASAEAGLGVTGAMACSTDIQDSLTVEDIAAFMERSGEDPRVVGAPDGCTAVALRWLGNPVLVLRGRGVHVLAPPFAVTPAPVSGDD
jgi:hypothetical protein